MMIRTRRSVTASIVTTGSLLLALLTTVSASSTLAAGGPAPQRLPSASSRARSSARSSRPLAPHSTLHAARTVRPLLICQLFAGEVAARRPAADPGQEASPMPTLETYWKTLDTIQNQFYNPDLEENPDSTGLTYAAIRGVLGSLSDPYTRFLPPDQYEEMQRENRGSFPGIGVELRSDNGRIYIDKVVPDSPAQNAPLRVDDELLTVDGAPVAGKTTDEVGDMLRGDEGTSLQLSIRRAGQVRSYSLVRREVSYPHFESRILDGNIGYMHLMMFDEQAGENVQRALDYFSHHGVRGIILDLRDNPGGLLNSAVDVASKFIPRGTVVWVQERGGERNALRTNGTPHLKKLPLVVLVNHFSASASEIVSGAVRDTHSGVLVGLTTWGKGLVQEVIPLSDNSAIALTTARYYTPNGSDINRKGIVPDVQVGRTVEDPEDSGSDPQTDRAKAQVDAEQLQRAVAVLHRSITTQFAHASAHSSPAHTRIARRAAP